MGGIGGVVAKPSCFVQRLVLFALVFVVALPVCGCATSGAERKSSMLEYLSSKYGEAFEFEDISADDFLPPELRREDALIVHAVSDPKQLFIVTDEDGEFTDQRVMAAWDREYEEDYSARIAELFGEDAAFRVQGGAPDSSQLGPSDLMQDPAGLFQNRNRRSVLKFLVAVPTSGSVDPSDYADAILSAWSLVKSANSGDGRPQLVVYFYDAKENPNRYMDLRAVPSAAISWESMPGARGRVAVTVDTQLQTADDVQAAYYGRGDQ